MKNYIYMFRGTLFFVGIFIFTASFYSTANAQTLSCLKYQSNSTPPGGYGVSWDVTSSLKELLVKSNCPTSGNSLDITIGKGSATQYIWGTTYVYGGTSWTAYTLTGTSADGGWLIGQGNKTVTQPFTPTPANPLFFVGYVCTPVGSTWKCGCANASCTTKNWQLQAYMGAGGGGGGSSGFVRVAKSQCISKYSLFDKPFSQGVHENYSGSGSAFDINPVNNRTTDLRGVTLQSYQHAFSGPTSIVTVRGYSDACLLGGRFIGVYDPYTENWAANHGWANYSIGIDNGSGTFTMENMVLKNSPQDSVAVKGAAPNNGFDFTMRGIWIIQNGDDWLQNDNCSDMALIEDVLVDGTRQGLSMRPGADSNAVCGNFHWTFRNSLINHVCVKGTDGDGISSPQCPNGYKTGQPFKFDGSAIGNPTLTMENVLIRMESLPTNNCKQIENQYPSHATANNVVIVWDPKVGNDPWPGCNLPSGWTVKQGAEGRNLWNAARAEWLEKHGCNESTATCTFADSY